MQKRESGQALVEFTLALFIPLLLWVFFYKYDADSGQRNYKKYFVSAFNAVSETLVENHPFLNLDNF